MDESSSRLYSGPLSRAAQKVLAVLRAQSPHASPYDSLYSSCRRPMERCYGSQTEACTPSSWSLDQDEWSARDACRPWSQMSRDSTSYQNSSHISRPPSCYEHMQTPDSPLSTQASNCSSSRWDASFHRQASQTEVNYQLSQTSSHRGYKSSRALPSAQREVSQTPVSSHRRDLNTSFLSGIQATPWRNSTDEIRPSFILSLSQEDEGQDELFPTKEHCNEEDPLLALLSVSSCFVETDMTTSDADKEIRSTQSWNVFRNEREESGASSSQSNPTQTQSNTLEEAANEGEQQSEPGTARTGREHLPPTDTNQSACWDTLEPALIREKEMDSGQMLDINRDLQDRADRVRWTEMGQGTVPTTDTHKSFHSEDEKQTKLKAAEMKHESETNSPAKSSVEGRGGEENPHRAPSLVSSTTDTLERTLKERSDELETVRNQCYAAQPRDRHESVEGAERTSSENLGREGCPSPTPPAERRPRGPCFRPPPCLRGNPQLQENAASGSTRGSSLNFGLAAASSCTCSSGPNFSGWDLTGLRPRPENSSLPMSLTPSHQPSSTLSISLKRKRESTQNSNGPAKIFLTRPSPRWEPPYSLQENALHGGVGEQMKTTPATSIPEPSALVPQPQATLAGPCILQQIRQCEIVEGDCKSSRNPSKQTPFSVTCKQPKRTKCGTHQTTKTSREGAQTSEPQDRSRAGLLTTLLTSGPGVTHSWRLSPEEKMEILERAGQAEALVLTMVFQDGTTQLDPEQKLTPPVCGLLVLMKNDTDSSTREDTLRPQDTLVHLKLEHTHQEPFTRDVLLQVLSRSQLVVCYKAKDLLCTALKFYKQDLNWRQVAGCHIQDPQVSGWLLDPEDPSSSYQDLLDKHLRAPCITPVQGTRRVISGLYSLYRLNLELCSKLQSQGLWQLYSNMELNMIPVLAALESHRIHVDKDVLKRTSDLLGAKMRQLEQEAHRAAGQIFLLTSNTQLRTVLFEKLRLHERCENKRLPKTINKQQSTSEAALLQLQDLHPLPRIILDYRQVHKTKSTFVDGILSCMMSKDYISSTWHQTSAVTGRITAKHPNFQALPRQPLQITKKQYIQGEEEEVVTFHSRAMFIPQEGWTFVAADFCQMELRLLAHLSSDPELLRIFTNPQADVFTLLSSQWKRVSEDEVTSEDREQAKRIVYSVVYGAGRERLSGILGMNVEQASRFQDSFLQTYREVPAFIQRTIQQCHRQGYVLSIMGRRRTLHNINSPDWATRMQAERQAVNFVVQGSAADLCKMAMIRIFNLVSSSSSLSIRLIAQLHDELLYEVEDSQMEEFAALVKSTMESLQHINHLGVHLKVPLKVAVSSGKSWGSMSELHVPPTSPSV